MKLERDTQDRRLRAFFVTTFYLDIGNGRVVRSRTPGFFASETDAISCVKENWGDIYEVGYYNYAVIEHQAEGLYPTEAYTEEGGERWFEARYIPGENWPKGGSYEISEVPKPAFLEKTFGYAFG